MVITQGQQPHQNRPDRTFLFVNSPVRNPDLELNNIVTTIAHDLEIVNSLNKFHPNEKTRTKIKASIENSEIVIVGYGKITADWIDNQLFYCQKIEGQRPDLINGISLINMPEMFNPNSEQEILEALDKCLIPFTTTEDLRKYKVELMKNGQ